MSYALVEYCLTRLPTQHLAQLRQLNVPFELHAVPFQILEKQHDVFGFDWVERLVWRAHDLRKPYNYIRPELVLAQESGTGRRVAILTLMPGLDYIRHYASIVEVAHRANPFSAADAEVKCVVYPQMIQSIMDWTGLTNLSAAIQPGDVVVLGFVAELLPLFQRIVPSSEILSQQDTTYYGLVRLQLLPGLTFSLVGVKYSYWGNLGGIVVEQLALRQPRAICYVAKQGTLVSPDDIHRQIYSPTRYMVFDKGEPAWISAEHPSLPINPLSSRFPCFDRGLHVSTPTIVEQDVSLRALLHAHGAVSIDNELSQMARALTSVHESHPSLPCVQLLPLMFVTDYLRRPEELSLRVRFDLTSRDEAVSLSKRSFLSRAAHLLLETFAPSVHPLPRAVVVGTGYGAKTILPALRRRGVAVLGLNGGVDREKTLCIARANDVPHIDLPLEQFRKSQGGGADLLFIASPHATHSGLVREALGMGGWDLVCEKPVALDLGMIEEMIAMCPPVGERLCLVNHPLRFYRPFHHLRSLVEGEGGLGEIEVCFRTRRLENPKVWKGADFSKAEGGGMLIAMATHFLDLIEWLVGEELRVDSLEGLEVWNRNKKALPVDGGGEHRTPDVESGFRMGGKIGRPGVGYEIDCDGAAGEELFTLALKTREGKRVRFLKRKGSDVVLEKTDEEGEKWVELGVRLEERVRTSSPWQVAFQMFTEELVEAICMGEREQFARRATSFEAYKRQVGVFCHQARVL